jgi:hypothetical protein
MSGTYRHLAPGRYQLEVSTGDGPAGVRRPDGHDVVVGVSGGSRSFSIDRSERVYYWWRGPRPRPGVRLTTTESQPRRRPARTDAPSPLVHSG